MFEDQVSPISPNVWHSLIVCRENSLAVKMEGLLYSMKVFQKRGRPSIKLEQTMSQKAAEPIYYDMRCLFFF